MRIAIDCMGGDHGLATTIPAVLAVLKNHPTVHIVCVGDEPLMRQAFATYSKKNHLHPDIPAQITLKHSEQVVTMDESPLTALRFKRKSSMALAIDTLRQTDINQACEACISAGNTGALVAISRYMLKTLTGIDRPALISAMPSQKGPVYLLDMGANVDCESAHLVQFAHMANIMVELLEDKMPKVGVLNIGVEDIKGNAVVKETIGLLQNHPDLYFMGSIEGDAMFEGAADIVVCDGFVGNVALKISEGVAHLFSFWIKQEIKKNPFRQLIGLLAFPIWRGLKGKYDPRIYNGATLLGLQGVVIKSHGGADAFAFQHAVEFAIRQVEQKVGQRISERFEKLQYQSIAPEKE